MQRVIKCKAYSKTHKKWYDRVLVNTYPDGPCSIVWDEDKKEWTNFDEFCGHIVEWTGIKNIWEGDILIDEFKRWFVVFWKEEEASFWMKKYNECECFPIHLDLKMDVIGNIYSNPELLEVI